VAIPRRKRTVAVACLVLAGGGAVALSGHESDGHVAPLVVNWSRPGAKPRSDARAARLVSAARETVAGNAGANNYVPTRAELARFRRARTSSGQTAVQFNPLTRYVTGRPGLRHPSTDELVQWVSHKWGIPTNFIRAQLVLESHWRQNYRGDQEGVPGSWYGRYPRQARVPGGSDVYKSLGIAQVKWTPDGAIGAGTEPLRWRSTAFSLDYYAATVRYYYDGACKWCEPSYGGGQALNSLGAWYSPDPWGNEQQQSYIGSLLRVLKDRKWAEIGR
jgi:hypothetical protein